jgi:glycosyltransferase involved in cell wall biosynthesis
VAGLLAAGRRVVVTVPTDGPLVAVMAELGADVRICPTPVLRKSVLSPAGMVGLALDSARGAVRGFGLLREIRPGALYVSTMTVPLWTVLGRLLRIPVTVHVHEAERSAAGWIRWAMSLPVALAHRVLVNSEYSRDVLLESAPRVRDRTSLVRNGVSGPPEVTAPRPRLDGALRLIFIGRLSPRKGPQVAVALLAELRRRGIDATLVLAGSVFPGYEPFEAELHEHVRRENLADRVAFLGFVDDVWALLRDCDVALVPSLLDEPFGNTAVEALLAARPVIVSDTSGLREATFGYRAATTVPPGDVGAWASAVEALVDRWDANRSAVLEDAVEAARRHAPEHFRSRVAELTTLRRGATR